METKIDEIAPDIYRLSTWIADVAPPAGFTFNQFVIRGEEPFLFHTGMRQLFPLVSDAVDRVVGVKNLRWISFAHVEADELGAMNQFLAAAPAAEVVHGPLAVMVSLNDLADRPPRAISDQLLDIGGKQLRFIPTPHVPHNWESGLWFEETTRTPAGRRPLHVGRRRPSRHHRRSRRASDARRGRLPPDLDGTGPRPHPPPARRSEAGNARGDARTVVQRRRHRPAPVARRQL
jgi:hypothetical protein